jgi:hypothetical protein
MIIDFHLFFYLPHGRGVRDIEVLRAWHRAAREYTFVCFSPCYVFTRAITWSLSRRILAGVVRSDT